jgi:hypothetical protein
MYDGLLGSFLGDTYFIIICLVFMEGLYTVADLQCQVKVTHKRENFNASYDSTYYSTITVLKYTVF